MKIPTLCITLLHGRGSVIASLSSVSMTFVALCEENRAWWKSLRPACWAGPAVSRAPAMLLIQRINQYLKTPSYFSIYSKISIPIKKILFCIFFIIFKLLKDSVRKSARIKVMFLFWEIKKGRSYSPLNMTFFEIQLRRTICFFANLAITTGSAVSNAIAACPSPSQPPNTSTPFTSKSGKLSQMYRSITWKLKFSSFQIFPTILPLKWWISHTPTSCSRRSTRFGSIRECSTPRICRGRSEEFDWSFGGIKNSELTELYKC